MKFVVHLWHIQLQSETGKDGVITIPPLQWKRRPDDFLSLEFSLPHYFRNSFPGFGVGVKQFLVFVIENVQQRRVSTSEASLNA